MVMEGVLIEPVLETVIAALLVKVVGTLTAPLIVVLPLRVRVGMVMGFKPLMVLPLVAKVCVPLLAMYVPLFTRLLELVIAEATVSS